MKHIINITVLLCLQVAAFAQITPSVYAGMGMFTNLGGAIGLGTEIRYGNISASLAGGLYDIHKMNHDCIGDNPYLGYDVGLKYYVYKGLYTGVNYGLVRKLFHSVESDHNLQRVEDIYAFTFSVGYKIPFYKGLYGTPYIGATTNKEANHFMGQFIPSVGFIIGYDIKKQ